VTHCSDEDLIFHYYGNTGAVGDVSQHLAHCAQCAEAYRDLADTLAMIPADEVPERGPQYGLEVWQRVRPLLPEPRASWIDALRWHRALPVVLASALLVAGFVVGRSWPPAAPTSSPVSEAASAVAGDAQRRILLTAVADHLDRSGRVLTDIVNAPEGSDISAEQVWADDLLATSRLYRQDAADAGERSIAEILDDLERALLEIVHSPAKTTPADLELMRRRIDAASLLFKVRVMSDELERRGRPSSPAGHGHSQTRVSTVS
jgi:hypothetical protein